ncbi:uncharacterized protein LOC121860471 [Homarus americanus]|uniref:uncharacterized protein LOC121860471 n=1 Tax=Homarus americanus TaxID=6706 RepID=UPI001C450093|nr:uncharacterized protein LOC121860471 [Homarus americanus]
MLWFVLMTLLSVTLADPKSSPDYGPPRPCYPSTVYVNQIDTVIQEVPVYDVAYDTEIVQEPNVNYVANTVFSSSTTVVRVPEEVTTTYFQEILEYVTQTQTSVETVFTTEVVEETEYTPIYSTVTSIQNVINTVYDTVEVVTTQYDIQVIPSIDVRYQTIYSDAYVPQIVKETKTVYDQHTYCPTRGYGKSY